MASKIADRTNYDYLLIVIVAALLLIGLMMVYSTTFAIDPAHPTTYIVRQLWAAGIGLVVLVIVARIPYQYWRKLTVPIMGATLLLLLLVLVIGEWRFGARLGLVGGSFQPSEVAKFAVVLYVADWLSSKGEKIRQVTYGLIPFSILIGILAGLIVRQPDYGAATLIVTTAFVMFFLAGADLLQLAIGTVVGGVTFVLLVTRSEYAYQRLTDYIKSMTDPVSEGSYQIQQALIALGFGGVFGRGLGNSQQKFHILPLAHSDSVFAIIGEELGLIGCLVVLGLFTALAYRGFCIAQQAPDTFGMILAAGLTFWLTFQALVNMAVVTATLPFTGITLPFISYGGSSLVMALAAVGLLLSVSKGKRGGEVKVHAAFDFWRGDRRPRLSGARSRGSPSRRRKPEHARSD